MTERKIVPIRPKKDAYDRWLFTQECLNLWRKDTASYWYNQAKRMEGVSDELHSKFIDHYYLFMGCANSYLAKFLNINISINVMGTEYSKCFICEGRGYIGEKTCICKKCQGWGKNMDWILEHYKHRNEGSITIIFKKGQAITGYKEFGHGFWSIL